MERSQVLKHRIKKLQHKYYGKEPETVDEIFEMVKVISKRNLQADGSDLVGMRFELDYNDEVLSTHSCTLLEDLYKDTKVKPGFAGRIWLRFSNPCYGFSSGALFGTATWTGSGGSGWDEPWKDVSKSYHRVQQHIKKTMQQPYCLGYDYRFFLADFPDLEKAIEQELIVAKLKDADFESKFQKTWISSDQLEKDTAFMDLCIKTESRRVLVGNY